MSAILGPDGMPATREKNAFGPATLEEFPTYTDAHWSQLMEAAKSLHAERMTTLISTPMALVRADFIQLAVNVKRLREENDKLKAALTAVSEATDLASCQAAAAEGLQDA
jgi:hypothetical protein